MAHTAAMRLRAQEPEEVSGEATCATCVIALDTVVTIGGLDGPGQGFVSMFSGVAVDKRKRILVWEAAEAEIAVFDSTGQYLRTIGGPGRGPGEYQSISHIGVGSRYIHVFDSRGRTMLDYDLQVRRVDRFPGRIMSAAVLTDDVAVFVASVPTPGSIGHKLHMLSPSGEMASYGYDGGVYSRERMSGATTTRVAGTDDTVWAVSSDSNRLVRWDLAPDPKVGRVFDRRVAEFDNGGDEFMPATMGSAMLDDRGLWLVWHSADPDRTGPPPSLESLRPSSIDVDGLRDSWLDLVDPATGRTIARYHQDNALGRFAGGSGYLADYHETDAGVPFLRLLKPRLSRR